MLSVPSRCGDTHRKQNTILAGSRAALPSSTPTCCLSPSPNVRRADNFLRAQQTKSLDIATATIAITLSPLRIIRLALRICNTTVGRRQSFFALFRNSHRSSAVASSRHATHARRRNSLARSPAQIDPQLLSSQFVIQNSGSAETLSGPPIFA